MREIKFRAWDKVHRAMREVAAINWIEETVLLWIVRGSAKVTVVRDFDQVTLMQSTGLFDKNGREIYGGDIARYGVNYGRINKIVYEQGCFQLQGNGGLAPLRYHHLLDSNTPDIEVIGNIHDDPELLKGRVKND